MPYTKEQYESDKAIVESVPKIFADRYEFYSESDHAFYTFPDEANIAIAYYISTGSTSYESSVYVDYVSMQRLDDLIDKVELYERLAESERLRYETIQAWSDKFDKAQAKIDELEKQKAAN